MQSSSVSICPALCASVDAGVLLLLFFLPGSLLAAEVAEAEKLFYAGKYAECSEICAKEIDAGTWLEKWRTLKIRSEMAAGEYSQALATLEKALKRYSSSSALRLLGYEVLRFNNQPSRADRLLDEIEFLARRYPWRYSNPIGRVEMGRFFLLRGADAKQVLDLFFHQAKKDRPDYSEAYVAAGQLALEKQDFSMAVEEFEQAIKLTPQDPNGHYHLARALAPSNSARADESLQRALKLNPYHVESLLMMVDQGINSEQIEQVEELIARILKVNHAEPRAWAYKAVLANLAADYQAEILWRRLALSATASSPRVDHLIGRKLSENYRFAEGARYQRQSLRLDGDFLPAKLQLCQDLLRLGEEEEGWRLAGEVYEEDGYNVVAHNLVALQENLAKFQTLQGDDFIVRMDAHEAGVYGWRVLDLLHRAKKTLCEKYEVELNEPIVVEIFPEQKDFAIRTFGLPGGAGFLGVCFGRVITTNSPASQTLSPTNWQSVLWHEFCHVVTLHKTNNKMPRWLSEGISVYEEIQENPTWGQAMDPHYRQMILAGELTPASQLSAAFLNPESPLHLQFAYYESSLVVRYLVDHHGQETLKKILTDLGVGMPINTTLERHTGSLAELDEDFANYAVDLAENLAPEVDWEQPDFSPQADAAELEEWNAQHPDNFWGLSRFVQKLLEEKKWQEAKAPLQRLLDIYPDYIGADNAYSALAMVYRRLNETEQEKAVLKRWAALDADSVAAYRRLMELSEESEDWQSLYYYAQQLMAVNPLQRQSQEQLAEAAEQIDKPAEAIRASRALLMMDPVDPALAHYRLARMLQKVGNLEEARRETLKALEQAPRFRDAHRTLLELLSRRQNLAAEKVDKAEESMP